MSGSENLRGIDYQISCSVLLILRALSEAGSLSEVRIESLDDEGEDLSLSFETGDRREIQIKKLAEGFNWTAARLRPILTRFAKLPEGTDCVFISDGSLSRELIPLVEFLRSGGELSLELRQSIVDVDLTPDNLASLAGRVQIETRFFPSEIESDPALRVRSEIDHLLLRGPFSLSLPATRITENLWHHMYTAGRTSAIIPKEELYKLFADAGMTTVNADWALYPTSDQFVPHTTSIQEITDVLLKGGVGLIYGIGGGGKTSVCAETATAVRPERSVCWIRIAEHLDISDLTTLLGDYCIAAGFPEAAEKLRNAGPADALQILGHVVTVADVALVLDRFEAASPRLQGFVRDLLSGLPTDSRRGGMIITSRVRPDWWPDLEREKREFRSFSLGALPEESASRLLIALGVCTTTGDCEELVDAVGGHAQSLVILSQVTDVSAEDLAQKGVDVARDWLLRRVIDELPEPLRAALAKISVFEDVPTWDLAVAVLGPFGPDALRLLSKRDLIRIEVGRISTHDAIRRVAVGLMSESEVTRTHRVAAEYLFEEIKKQWRHDESVLIETLVQWAGHLEAAGDISDMKGKYQSIVDADPRLLQTLFSVDQLGFPFEFEDETLEKTWELVDHLEEDGLIKERGKPRKRNPDARIFKLSGYTDYEILLIRGLCFLHGYGAFVGYLEDMRPNFSFSLQPLVCPWEHCIENSPLPGITRAEYEAGLALDRERLADPVGNRLEERHIAVLQARLEEGVPEWVEDEVDEELRDRSCPFFGHGCPNGATQAATCKANGSFEWAPRTGQRID